MEEQKLLKKHFFLHIVYNMVAFALIFIVFGVFVFFMVKNITFSEVDKQLVDAKSQVVQINEELEILYKIFDLENIGIFGGSINNFSSYSTKIDNPQVVCVLRDKNGNILNENDLGKMNIYIENIEFDSKNLDHIYNVVLQARESYDSYDLNISNKYHYRALNFEINLQSQSTNEKYGQLLINVNSEVMLINNCFVIICHAIILGIILSGGASLVLSRKTLKPVEDILKKQTEFVQNASHELRTPLTIIQAKQELLLQEPDAKIIDKSEEIMLTLNETRRLTKLTKDLMFLVRGTNSKGDNLHKEDVYIDEFLKSILAPYIDIAKAQEKKFVLNLNFNKDISIDTNKIHQLMVILLDNAIKYTENGDTIQVNTYLKDGKFVIEVCDTGIGISDDGLNRVFDRFYREDKARNRQTRRKRFGAFDCFYDCKST